MTTPPVDNLPASPSIPLTPEVRAAYQDLYNKMQAALDSTMDEAAIEALNAWQPEVDQVLRKDDFYKLAKTRPSSMRCESRSTTPIRGSRPCASQISSIASHFAMAGDIIAAIDKVLTLVPGA